MARSHQYRIRFKSDDMRASRWGLYVNVYADRSCERGYLNLEGDPVQEHPFDPSFHSRTNAESLLTFARSMGYAIERVDL